MKGHEYYQCLLVLHVGYMGVFTVDTHQAVHYSASVLKNKFIFKKLNRTFSP